MNIYTRNELMTERVREKWFVCIYNIIYIKHT